MEEQHKEEGCHSCKHQFIRSGESIMKTTRKRTKLQTRNGPDL